VNPSKSGARKMVLVSVFILVVLSVYKSRKPGSEVATFKRLWATGIVAIFLSILADFAPQIAGPFSLVIVLGFMSHEGDRILTNVLSKVTPNG